MGYRLDGAIMIDPPLNFAEIQTAQRTAMKMLPPKTFAAKNATPSTVFQEFMPVALQVEEFDRETDEGILKVRQAKTLMPPHRENAKLSYEIDVLVIALIKALPGHVWTGVITAIHSEMITAEKIVVMATGGGGPVENAVRKIQGAVHLRWEDGSPEEKVSDYL